MSIVDRIRKLKAQAESAANIGSEAEAQAFAALMQRLMVEHKVHEDQLNDPGKVQEPIVEVWSSGKISNDPSHPEPKYVLRRIEWVERLAQVVATAHYCKIIVTDRTAKICFVGKKSDVEAALSSFEPLLAAATALGAKEFFIAYWAYRRGEGPWERGFYRSFLLGFSDRLHRRYKDELNLMEKQLSEAKSIRAISGQVSGEAVSKTLVRIAKTSFDDIDSYFKLKSMGYARNITKPVSNFSAYAKGTRAADMVKLRPDKKLASGEERLLK